MPIYKNDKGYRIEVSYTDSFGKHKKIVRQNQSTSTLKGAKQVEAEIVSKVNLLASSGVGKNFGELFEYYKVVKKNEVREATLQQNCRRIEKYVMPYFKSKKLSSTKLNDYQAWKNEIDKLEVTTIYKNKIYKVFNELINFGIKVEYMSINQLKKLGNFKKSGEIIDTTINFWTKEEFDRFIEYGECDCAMNTSDNKFVRWGYYVAYNIMFYAGCRKSEVYPLTWHDYKNGSLSITKGLVYKVKGHDYVISAPKTKGSIREIPVPKQLAKVLEEHYKRCQSIYGFSDDFFICGGVAPLTDTMLDNIKNEWADAVGNHRIRIHDFRHSHASLLINNGANIQVVAKRLGHADIEMTLNTYSHMYQSEEDKAVALINSLE